MGASAEMSEGGQSGDLQNVSLMEGHLCPLIKKIENAKKAGNRYPWKYLVKTDNGNVINYMKCTNVPENK